MQSITGCDLSDLQREKLRISLQLSFQCGKLPKSRSKRLRTDSERSRIGLHYSPRIARAEACNHGQTYKAFFAYQAYLDGAPIGHHIQYGEHAGIAEVAGFQSLSGVMHHLMQLQSDELQFRQVVFTLPAWQSK